jgi:hypothetical protein
MVMTSNPSFIRVKAVIIALSWFLNIKCKIRIEFFIIYSQNTTLWNLNTNLYILQMNNCNITSAWWYTLQKWPLLISANPSIFIWLSLTFLRTNQITLDIVSTENQLILLMELWQKFSTYSFSIMISYLSMLLWTWMLNVQNFNTITEYTVRLIWKRYFLLRKRSHLKQTNLVCERAQGHSLPQFFYIWVNACH